MSIICCDYLGKAKPKDVDLHELRRGLIGKPQFGIATIYFGEVELSVAARIYLDQI